MTMAMQIQKIGTVLYGLMIVPLFFRPFPAVLLEAHPLYVWAIFDYVQCLVAASLILLAWQAGKEILKEWRQ